MVDELTFEDFHTNRNEIYRVIREDGNTTGQTPSTVVPLSAEFREKFSKVENATFIKYGGVYDLHLGDRFVETKYAYVDTTFFDVFSFPVVAGDPNLMKDDPQQIVLSEETARKLFGEASPIGKEVVCKRFRTPYYYKVAAVLKVPRKSHIQFDVLVSWNAFESENKWVKEEVWLFSERMHVYVQLRKGETLTEADRKSMRPLWSDRVEGRSPLGFQPLGDIHLRTAFKEPDDVSNHGNMQQIYLFSALALLVVLMGAFNFTTLSTARASQRFKEVGVRKVTGVKRRMLIVQFLLESLVQALFSLLMALALTELMLPLFNLFVGKDIALSFDWPTLLFALLGIVGVGCLAGSFPAFYMSSVNSLLAFKGGKQNGKKRTFVKALVCVQFVISIALIITTMVLFKQLNYLQNADVGIDKENMIAVNVVDWRSGADEFKQEVLKNPRVKNVTLGVELSDFLQGYAFEKSVFNWTDEAGRSDSLEMVGLVGDRDFIHTLGLDLIKGEPFGADPAKYWDGTYRKELPIVINEAAWKKLNVEDPVGMLLDGGSFGVRNARIVGVVKDFNFQPLREEIKPAYLYYTVQMFEWMYIQISPDEQAATLEFLKTKYEERRANMLFTPLRFSDVLEKNYARERQQSRMFLGFTVLAIIIAMMGVWGLVALSTEQRTKEVGIRKLNGAHSWQIVGMFCLEYVRWVGVAFVIACPVGYLLMDRWLSNFAYRVAIDGWLFPLAGLVVLSITVLTVVLQTWRAASCNPVTALRYE